MLTLPPLIPRFALTVFLKLLPQLAILTGVDKAPSGPGHAISSTDAFCGRVPLLKIDIRSSVMCIILKRAITLEDFANKPRPGAQ